MKNRFKIMVSFLVLFLLWGCASQQVPQSTEEMEILMETTEDSAPSNINKYAVDEQNRIEIMNDEDSPTAANPDSLAPVSNNILDYFPFKENYVKRFEGSGSEYADFEMFVQYLEDDRIQLLSSNVLNQVVTIYEKHDNEVKIVFSQPDVSYREKMLDRTGDIGTYLRGPVEVGTSWVNIDGKEMVITDVNIMVEGYPSIEVKSGDDLYYFGYQVGLVKQILNHADTPIISTLVETIEGEPVDVNYLLYQYEDGQWLQHQRTKPMLTNDIFRIVLQNDMIENNILPENTKINSMYKNRTDNRIYLDVSKEVYDDLESIEAEKIRLQSLVRTVGTIYGSDSIYLWVDNSAYEGSYVTMAKNELLKISQ